MAEDDDDESFGDFTSAPASNPSSSFQFNQQHSSWSNSKIATEQKQEGNDDDDDDEWGDFVETPLESAVSSESLAKPFDPFNFFASNPSSQSQFQSESAASSTRTESGLCGSESEKKTSQWMKLKGAIPLSIFGDIEDGEQVEEKRPGVNDPQDNNHKDSGGNVSSSNYIVKNGSRGNAYLGVGMSSDVIANLYNNNQHINLNNGLASDKNLSNFNTSSLDLSKKEPNLEVSGVNFDLVSAPKTGDLDTAIYLDDQNQKVNIQDGARANGTTNSNFGLLNMDFDVWNQYLNWLNMKSDLDISNQTQMGRVKSGSSQSNSNRLELELIEKKSSNIGEWNFDFDVFKPNSHVMDLGFQLSSSNANGGHGDKEDDGWEFKDANSESKVSNGNGKALSEEHKVLDTNTNSKEFINGSNGPLDLFFKSSGSFDFFSTSNGVSGSPQSIAVGMDSKSCVAAQNGLGVDTYLKKEQTENSGGPHSSDGCAESEEDFGKFAAAFEETGPREKAEPRLNASAEINSPHEFANFSNGSTDFFAASLGSIDLFAPVDGNSNNMTKVDVKVDTDPSAVPKVETAHNDSSLETHSKSEKINDQGVVDSDLVAVGAEFDDDFGEFTAASSEGAQGPEEADVRAENHKWAIPLSIFGDEEQETDGSLGIQDVFLHQTPSSKRNNCSSNSTISINDLISNLYSQAEKISSVDSVPKPIQNGLTSSEAVSSSNVANEADDSDDSCWEFKDAFFERSDEEGTSLQNNGDAVHSSSSTELKLNHYVDFYSKLIDKLHFLAKCHLESLKEAQTTATASGDAKLATLIEEIQEACNESGPKNATSKEPLGDNTWKESDISVLLKILHKPEFQILESEYSLESKLSLVEKDSRSTIQLIKHAKTTLKILSLGSLEEQLTYVSTWSKIISVCAEELRYGAQIWRQSSEKNVQSQILTDPRGKRFLLALGEIYRVAIMLEASVKLYKPWTLLSSMESSSISHLLDECHALWRSSGLQEALSSMSVSASLEGDNSASLLVDSIKYFHDLDALAPENHVFARQGRLCQICLLTSSVVPGMPIVEWGGQQYFVKLANLWANLISSDIPKLPSLYINC